MPPILRKKAFWLAFALTVAGAMFIATFVATNKARAGTSWTGVSVGVHGQRVTGTAEVGGPVGLESRGQAAGTSVFYEHQFGAMVAGIGVEASKMWGDLETLGVDYDVALVGTLGVLPTPAAKLYALAEWSRTYTSGPEIDAWGLGAGMAVKIKGTPFELDMNYRHRFAEDVFGPAVKVEADIFRAGLRVKFGPDLKSIDIFDDAPAAAPACDPKFANCKKR